MQQQLEDITIALAGILQSIALVNELSQTGKVQQLSYESCIYSIFQLDPKTAQETYGGLKGVKLGLQKVIDTLGGDNEVDKYQHRHLLSLIHLQKRLSKSTKLLNELAQHVERVQKQANYFYLTHPTVVASLADVYLKTASNFRFRVMLVGPKKVFQVREHMERIRALLLSGVRSTILWRQAGGSRLQLLFMRHKLLNTATMLLQRINEAEQSLQEEPL